MNAKVDLFTLILIGAIALVWLPDGLSPSPRPVPHQRPAPAAELQTLVAPFRQWQSPVVGSAYRDFAWAVEKSDLKTTGQLRTALQRFGGIMQGTGTAAMPGFREAFNRLLAEQLGLDDKPLDKAKAAAVIDAVGWRLGG